MKVKLWLCVAVMFGILQPLAPSSASPLGCEGGHRRQVFEVGQDTGDRAGEFQLWKERRNLTQQLPFLGYRDLHYDPQIGLLVLVTGIGTARSAAATMALGLDSRFDLSQSYWIVAGISGFDPADASVGSAAWAEYLVDGDLSHE